MFYTKVFFFFFSFFFCGICGGRNGFLIWVDWRSFMGFFLIGCMEPIVQWHFFFFLFNPRTILSFLICLSCHRSFSF